MTSPIKDVFDHALLSRAAYTDLTKGADGRVNWNDLLDKNGQSLMTPSMVKFLQDKFDFIDSSLDNNIEFSFDNEPTINISEDGSIYDNPLDYVMTPSKISEFISDNFAPNGYDGIIFKEKGTENYVLANRGTQVPGISIEQVLSGLADFHADFNLAITGDNEQLASMEELLSKIPDTATRITSTGHSLGGGIASVMGVWFDEPAVIFDSAPFKQAA